MTRKSFPFSDTTSQFRSSGFLHRLRILAALVCVVVFLGACSTSSVATNFSGNVTPEGRPKAYVNTTNYALHVLFGYRPLVGDASVEGSVSEFTRETRERGSSKSEITNMTATNLWWIFPPFSFILTPMISDTYGYAY